MALSNSADASDMLLRAFCSGWPCCGDGGVAFWEWRNRRLFKFFNSNLKRAYTKNLQTKNDENNNKLLTSFT
jgi:hypothetical protein